MHQRKLQVLRKLRIIRALFLDRAPFQRGQERQRIHHANQRLAQHIPLARNMEHVHRRRVDLLHLQVLVDHENAVWRVAQDIVGEALRLVHQKRQAHADIRLTVIDRNRLLAAGVVAAASAVELVFLAGFARLGKDTRNLRLGRNRARHADVGMPPDERARLRLGYGKILFAGKRSHRLIMPHGRVVVFLHHGPANAAAGARAHLKKALVQVARRDVRKRRLAVVRAIDRQASIARIRNVHGFEDAANGRKQPRPALLCAVEHRLRHDIRRGKHPGKLVKREHRVHGAVLRFVFFGEARADEDGLRLRHAPLDVLAVRNHRRHDRREIFDQLRVIFADEQVDGMAAGADDHVHALLLQLFFIFALDQRGSKRGFLCRGKAELL